MPKTDIAEALAAPFREGELRFKPQSIAGSRALVVAFVDARAVQDRLDEVLGVMGWQDSYQCLPDGSVVCRLRVRVGEEWITKEDVGGQSEQPDEGDRRKAAFSDALKRAAVKFGVGRYLYRLKPQWVDYDPQKRQIVGTPRLPGSPAPKAEAKPVAKPAPQPKPAPASDPLAPLAKRIAATDAARAAEGVCSPGELSKAIRAAAKAKPEGRWDADGVAAWVKSWCEDKLAAQAA